MDVAAPTLDPIHGKHGYSLDPTALRADVDPAAHDLLLIPGGAPDGAPATVRAISNALTAVTSEGRAR